MKNLNGQINFNIFLDLFETVKSRGIGMSILSDRY